MLTSSVTISAEARRDELGYSQEAIEVTLEMFRNEAFSIYLQQLGKPIE